MAVKIGWCVNPFWSDINDAGQDWKTVLFYEPEPADKIILQKYKDYTFSKCPAVPSFYHNSFIIRCPFDLDLTIDLDKKICYADQQNQNFIDKNLRIRWADFPINGKPLVSISIDYVFVCDEDVEIECQKIPLMDNEISNKIDVVPGSFNIHKWVRPIDFTFVITDPSASIKLKRNDPIFLVKFRTKNNQSVELTQIDNSDQKLKKILRSLHQTRVVLPRQSLNSRYLIAKNFLSKHKWFSKFKLF